MYSSWVSWTLPFMDVAVSGSQHPEIEGAIVGHQGFVFEGIQQHLECNRS